VRIADGKPNSTKAMIKSSLGEVLLALARPTEAHEVLKEADKLAPDHPFYHEIRWDLAQADLCTIENEKRSNTYNKKSSSFAKEASKLLVKIHNEEQNREFRPFTSNWLQLDPAYLRKVCAVEPGARFSIESTSYGNELQFVLHGNRPVYESFKPCLLMGVKSKASDYNGGLLTLHVWGGDVNKRIDTDGIQVITLDYETRDSRDFYFAQLEKKIKRKDYYYYEPVSKIYPIETRSSCKKNMITLVFEEANGTSSP